MSTWRMARATPACYRRGPSLDRGRALRYRRHLPPGDEVEDDQEQADDEGDVDEAGRDLEGEADDPERDENEADDGEHACTSPPKMLRGARFGLPGRSMGGRDYRPS